MSKSAVYGAVIDQPLDPVHKLAYADILEEEEGADALAHAYRWMAGRGKHPHHRTHYRHPDQALRKVPEAYSWAWWPAWVPSNVRSREVIHDRHVLPRLVFLAVGGRDHLFCGSFDEAVMSLAYGLERMRLEREANPP